MSKVLVSEENLTNIANAIREKNGETTTYKPGDMATAIQNISSGGDSELEVSFMSSIDGSLGANVTKLPSGITSIGDGAFYKCTNLALTTLSNEITKIGKNAFESCTNLALTELPSSLEKIYAAAFRFCTKLSFTKLPSKLTYIDEYSFNGCTNLALTELPSGLTYLGMQAFYKCSNIELTEIPSGITNINDHTFYACSKLSTITILGLVTNIRSNAFSHCSNLSSIILPNVTKVPTGTSNMFSNTPIASGTGYIYVPDTLVDSFKTATNWSTYADQIKPISELEASA